MDGQAAWQWNEVQQLGTDYTDVTEVERYERRMGEFRDLAGEDTMILGELALQPGSHVLEIGTGTGHFARVAAAAGHRVTAVDVSPVMLQYAAARAEADGLTGIEYVHAGFLTFPHEAATFDAAVSVAALHHLPDLWKAVALQNLHRALKPGGRLVLRDVVFAWSGDDHAAAFDRFVADCPAGMAKEAARHIAQELSTVDWIMAGLLERAGFRILRSVSNPAALVHYLCER